MRTLLIAVLFLAAGSTVLTTRAYASSDEYHEMKAAQKEIREANDKAKKAAETAAAVKKSTVKAEKGSPLEEAVQRFRQTWKETLIALGEDSNDENNYPNLLLACDVLPFSGDNSAPACGLDESRKALEAESIKHHVLANKATNVLISQSLKKDTSRVETILMGILSLEGHQQRVTEELMGGKKYRYAYDQNSLAGESFQKDVKSTWAPAREIAEIILNSGGNGGAK